MNAPLRRWKVLPHDKPVRIDDNIVTVVGRIRMPLMTLPRRMTVVRLKESRLAVFSAIALDEEGMATIEAFGRPAYLIVPNDHHRLDARAWKERYPAIRVVAPQGARSKIAKKVSVDTTAPRFDDPGVQFLAVPGTRSREAALVVRTPRGTTLVLNDIVGNIQHRSGIEGWLLQLAGFAGDMPQIPKVVKMTMIDDKFALRSQLLQWSLDESLRRILVSHGEPIEDNPRQALRDLAQSLE